MPELRRREPIFQAPGVIGALLILMALAQAAQLFLTGEETLRLISLLGFVPGRLTEMVDPNGVAAALVGLPPAAREAAVYFLGGGQPRTWTLLTYAFIHGGWAHLLANAVWLVAFGSPVARRIGTIRFLGLFCVSALGGAFAHWLTHPFDAEPVVGASAAISGVMAAAARFVFQRGGPIGEPLAAGEARPVRPLGVFACFLDGRALAFIAMWFVVNLVIGLAAQPLGVSGAPVAWQAHIGGFVVGLALFSAFDRPPQAAEPELASQPSEREPIDPA